MPLWLMKFLPDFAICQAIKFCASLTIRDGFCAILTISETQIWQILGLSSEICWTWADWFWFCGSKAARKLSGWKSRLLSLAGRRVLIHQSQTPSQIMLCKVLYSQAESVRELIKPTGIFYGDQHKTKKLHLVNWNKVTMPKESGGSETQNFSPASQDQLEFVEWW